jgi:hypothetical protein
VTPDEMIAVIQAHKAGKKIECKPVAGGDFAWTLVRQPVWDFSCFIYRVALEIRLRPWKPEEVPQCIIRPKPGTAFAAGHKANIWWSTCACIAEGFYIGALSSASFFNFERALADFEHSTDGGKTWRPCGVEEVV